MNRYIHLIQRSAVHAVRDGLLPQEVVVITKDYLDEIGVKRVTEIPVAELRKAYGEMSIRFGEAVMARRNPNAQED